MRVPGFEIHVSVLLVWFRSSYISLYCWLVGLKGSVVLGPASSGLVAILEFIQVFNGIC